MQNYINLNGKIIISSPDFVCPLNLHKIQFHQFLPPYSLEYSQIAFREAAGKLVPGLPGLHHDQFDQYDGCSPGINRIFIHKQPLLCWGFWIFNFISVDMGGFSSSMHSRKNSNVSTSSNWQDEHLSTLYLRFVWWIVLNYPMNTWNVPSTLCHACCQKGPMIQFHKLCIGITATFLLLLTLTIKVKLLLEFKSIIKNKYIFFTWYIVNIKSTEGSEFSYHTVKHR